MCNILQTSCKYTPCKYTFRVQKVEKKSFRNIPPLGESHYYLIKYLMPQYWYYIWLKVNNWLFHFRYLIVFHLAHSQKLIEISYPQENLHTIVQKYHISRQPEICSQACKLQNWHKWSDEWSEWWKWSQILQNLINPRQVRRLIRNLMPSVMTVMNFVHMSHLLLAAD